MPEPQPGTHLGDLEVVRLLGRGGMASVYEARAAGAGDKRAIKLMHPGGGGEEYERRFRREFRILAGLKHPNIAQVYDWGMWEGRPYYVMELVEGQDLKTILEEAQDEPPSVRFERARRVLIQVARALEYIHLRGLVHRDITPSNILLMQDGTAKLMDFGVVKELGADMTAHGEVLGTIAYIAPEQISGGVVDARTDLYALGSVLYWMLTGRRPFHARSIAGYLDKHLNVAPRPPHELAPGVPKLLEDICLRLLQKEPKDRLASASHLLTVLEQGGEKTTLYRDLAEWPPVMVGRNEAIATLLNGLLAVQEGGVAVVTLSGAPGVGRTRLARMVVETARAAGLSAVLARAEASDSSLAVFGRLFSSLKGEGAPAPRILEDLFSHEDAVGERLPVFSSFKEMIVERTPRVVVLEDMELADRVSMELAEYLLRNTVTLGSQPVLWVLTAAPGRARSGVELAELCSRAGVKPQAEALEPLEPTAVEELLLSLVPDSEAAQLLARRIHREAEGNAAFVAEILQGLVEEGTVGLVEGRRQLTIEADAVERIALPVPRSVREASLAWLKRLSPTAWKLANLLAIARQELTLTLLQLASGLEEETLVAAVEEALEAGVLRELRQEGEESFDLAQHRLRDILPGTLSPEERVRLHQQVGEAVERAARRRLNVVVESLAWHFEQGQRPVKAFAYLVRAGTRLLDRSFAAEAKGFFDRALSMEPAARAQIPLEDADRSLVELLLKRGETEEHLGAWTEAGASRRWASSVARELSDDRLQARAATALAGQARHEGEEEQARAHYQEALRLAERIHDASLKGEPLQGLGKLAWRRRDLESAARYFNEAMSVGESIRDESATAAGQGGMGLVALCRGQVAEARRYLEAAVPTFERLGQLALVIINRVNLVEIYHLMGNLKRGMELVDKTLAQAREAHYLQGESHALAYRSLLLVDIGRPQEGKEAGEHALQIAEELGDGVDELGALVMLIRAEQLLQRRSPADAAALRAHLSQAIGLLDRFDPEGYAPMIWAWQARQEAEEGRGMEARATLSKVHANLEERWPYQECRVELALARAYEALGEGETAARYADAAIRRADACGFRFYALKGHALAARHALDEGARSRHRRIADGLARSLAANLGREDAERFLGSPWLKM